MTQLGPYSDHDVFTRVTQPANGLSAMPHTAVILAHPDDETIAIGARMSRFRDAHFICITNGAPANGQDAAAHGFASIRDYGDARIVELRAALRTGGIPDPRLHLLNIPDQETSFRLVEITRTLAGLLAEIAPEAILTHPFEGGHPDHDASAFAVHHAVAANELEGMQRPVIFEAAFYHHGLNGMETGDFLPAETPTEELVFELTAAEAAAKRDILACYRSQRDTLQYFTLERECFRLAPRYDFTRRPHDLPFLYDQFPWGVDSHQFLRLAREAEAQLSPEPAACH